jgi:hypothetical protein
VRDREYRERWRSDVRIFPHARQYCVRVAWLYARRSDAPVWSGVKGLP